MARVEKNRYDGWPTWIKNKDARELHIATAMKGQRYDGVNEVRFKQTLNNVINWGQIQKLKRSAL